VDQDVERAIDNAGFRGAEVLEKIEVRPAIGAKGYQLSVDHRFIRKILQCGRDIVELLVQDVLSPGIERRSTSTSHNSSR
jgi:hypothetical protein